MTRDEIIKRGYFDCEICGERHMAMIPFIIVENGDVMCASHCEPLPFNIQESKCKLEDSIFLLVNRFESVYGVAVKSVKLKQHGLDDRLTGVELVVTL